MRKRKIFAALITMVSILTATVVPAYAEEQYPLQGTFPYTLTTRESVDAKLADGWMMGSNPYGDVGTAVPFVNNPEWVQINNYKSSVATGINSAKILITLAGLTPAPDSISGSALTAEEDAVKIKVVEYLNSYDWKTATEYEKAAYTAEYIANRCRYQTGEGDSLPINSSYSCLVNGVSLCDGFAATYHLLTRAVGLKSIHTGTVSHAWNYVMIDNQWYYIDISDVSQPTASFSIQDSIQKYLKQPATDMSYIWTETGVDFDFDNTIPSEPIY